MPFFITRMFIVRIVLALLFIASAILKVVSVDEFELFVFKWSHLGWNTTSVVSRLVIAWEGYLGIALLFNIKTRRTALLSVATLVAFTALLVVLMLNGETENCQCFGAYIDLDPQESILKNIVLFLGFGFLLWKGRISNNTSRYEILLLLSLVVAVSIVSPPDFLLNKRYSLEGINTDFQIASLKRDIIAQEVTVDFNSANNRQILIFMSHSCSVCKRVGKKFATIEEMYEGNLPLTLIAMGSDTTKYAKYMIETGLAEHPTYYMNHASFLNYTKQLPTVFLLEENKVKEAFGYRSFNEKTILDFLGKP